MKHSCHSERSEESAQLQHLTSSFKSFSGQILRYTQDDSAIINMQNRLNAYRIMWVLVFYDLPTETRLERKIAASF